MARTKPEIVEVWADTGAKTDPNTQYVDPTKIETGWIAEIPFHESENFMRNRADQFLAHVNDYGVPHWDNVTEYPAIAWSRSTVDGKVYQANNLVTAGSTEPSANATDWTLVEVISKSQLLQSYDMTNGAANDINNIDITWNIDWDANDTIEIDIISAEASSSGRIGLALSSDGGSTWETFEGGTREAMSWTQTGLGVGHVFTGKITFDLRNHAKVPMCTDFSSGGIRSDASSNFNQGFLFDYSGTTLSSPSAAQHFNGWNTGANGLSTYMLRFTHESGNFTSGTLNVIGVNK